MSIEFLQPRFVGRRFDQHTLPVEVARDLAAYEELIIEVARVLYLKEHPDRERIPRGYADAFSLNLERVDEGSAKVALVVVVAAVGILTQPLQDWQNCCFKSRDLVAGVVTAAGANQRLPSELPHSLLENFDALGRSLRPDESVDLAPVGKPPATLTPEVRKRLLKIGGGKSYTANVRIAGVIVETNWEKDHFQLRPSGGLAVVVELPRVYRDSVRAAGGKERTQVQIAGLGIYDMEDQLQKMTEVHLLEASPNHELALEIESLNTLTDGWLDEGSKAPDQNALAWAKDQLVESFPEHLPFPQVAPTYSGGLFLEWIQDPMRISAEIMLPNRRAELLSVNVETGAADDTELNLEAEADWTAMYEFVRQRL